uniref:Mur ligase central domain-containing protein n=1 Tax=Quercus lobata TaxID=97700 RepID=A0A7N2M4Y5_QUELO
MGAPCLTHYEVVLQLVKYLEAHPRLGILYRINGDLDVEVFSNSGWVGMGSPSGVVYTCYVTSYAYICPSLKGYCKGNWVIACLQQINIETKIASLEVPTMGVVSQLQLDAMKVMGTHNYYNAAVAALCVLGLDLGLDANGMSSTIENLRAPPHRMEIVHRDANGVTWVDDSKATNVEATYTGLLGLKQQKSVILLGGLAKVVYGEETNGFEQLIDPLKYHRCVITFGSSGKVIQKTLSDNGLSIPCIGAKNMEDAVNCAKRMAKFGKKNKNGDSISLIEISLKKKRGGDGRIWKLLLYQIIQLTTESAPLGFSRMLIKLTKLMKLTGMLLYSVQVVRALMNSEILSTEVWFFRRWPSPRRIAN